MRPWPALLLAVGLAGCGSSVPPAAEPAGQETVAEQPVAEQPPAEPAAANADWFLDLLARTTELPAERQIAAPDGSFRARVAAEPGTLEQVEDGWYLPLSIGTEQPVECWVYTEGADLASSLAAISDTMLDHTAEQLGGEIEARQIHRLDAGAFGGNAWIALEWLYRLAAEGGAQAGQVKHLALDVSGGAVYCLHNETGYREAFTTVARGLAESLELAAAPAEPFYEEVFVIRIAEQPVGFTRYRFVRDAAGDVEITDTTALLIPTDRQTVQASDSIDLEWSTPDGRMIHAVAVDVEQGEVVTELHLDPSEDEDGVWVVSGSHEGEEIDATFEAADLRTTLGEMLALRRLLESGGETATFRSWTTGGDPTQPVTYDFELLQGGAAPGTRRVQVQGGPMTLEGDVEPSGSFREMKAGMGPAGFEAERVYQAGRVP